MKTGSVNRKGRKKGLSTAAAMVLCFVFAFGLLIAGAPAAEADTVTDTITIKVGYWGMPEEDYVEKVTFHWTELDDAYGGALPTHEEAYSFFRDAEDGTYSTVVVSARGFYLEDLLNYAGVNMSDIENISFYTKDHANGAFTSFTYEQLFEEPRYYFDDLPSKIRNEYNKAGILTGYTLDDSVWDNKVRVGTMLALESSWAQYDAGTEHAFPSFENMGAGTRFRLLFGQNDPAEARTNQSAKYVHTIALTIPGTPSVKTNSDTDKAGSGKIFLSNKVGTHRVTFNVASDEAMLDSVMGNLVWQSSDEKVLKIGNVSMTPSDQYNDAVTVVIDYEVLKEGGNATIMGSYMNMQLEGQTLVTSDKGNDTSDEDDDDDDTKGAGKDGNDSDRNSGGADKKSSAGNSSTAQAKRNLSLVQSGGSVRETPAAQQAAAAADDGPRMVSMDLENVFEPEEETIITRKDDSGKYAPYICVGLGGILILGGAASALQFRIQTGSLQIRLRKRG